MKIENLKKLKSTNPIVQNAIAHCLARNEGTSEGAKKGWETRKAGGAGGAEDDWDSMSETDRAIAERTAAKYGGNPKASGNKFKVGDKVTDGNSVFEVTGADDMGYQWKLIKGDGKDGLGKSAAKGGDREWAHETMTKYVPLSELMKKRKLSNACEGRRIHSTNPVVENALEYAANKACGKVWLS